MSSGGTTEGLSRVSARHFPLTNLDQNMFTLKDTWGGSILDADNSRKKGSTSRRFTPSSVISIGGFVYVASYDGNLKIYAPRDHDTFKSDLICNTFINPQIIKLGSGHYMSKQNLITLHPSFCKIWRCDEQQGSIEINEIARIDLDDGCVDFVTAETDISPDFETILILSVNASLFFVCNGKLVGNSVLSGLYQPKQVVYSLSENAVVCSSSDLAVKAYKVIKDSMETKAKPHWTATLGESILDLRASKDCDMKTFDIAALGSNSLFFIMSGGIIKSQILLNNPPFAINEVEGRQNILIWGSNGVFQVLNDTEIVWTAQDRWTPIDVCIGGFKGRQGFITILDNSYTLRITFFGTSSSALQTAPFSPLSVENVKPKAEKAHQYITKPEPVVRQNFELLLHDGQEPTTGSSKPDFGFGKYRTSLQLEKSGAENASLVLSAPEPLFFEPSSATYNCKDLEETRYLEFEGQLLGTPSVYTSTTQIRESLLLESQNEVSCFARFMSVKSKSSNALNDSMMNMESLRIKVDKSFHFASVVESLSLGQSSDLSDTAVFSTISGAKLMFRRKDENTIELCGSNLNDLLLPCEMVLSHLRHLNLHAALEDDFILDSLYDTFSKCLTNYNAWILESACLKKSIDQLARVQRMIFRNCAYRDTTVLVSYEQLFNYASEKVLSTSSNLEKIFQEYTSSSQKFWALFQTALSADARLWKTVKDHFDGIHQLSFPIHRYCHYNWFLELVDSLHAMAGTFEDADDILHRIADELHMRLNEKI